MSDTPKETALQKYSRFMAQSDEPSPIERLRFFCSLAMDSQDWLDVENLFSAVERERDALRKDAERYRFIRKKAWFDWDAVVLPKDFAYSEHAENAGLPEMTDEAIDAAIKEQK
jgi:hypothetical protein